MPGINMPGGFADYLAMPARHCFAVGAMDIATASLGEPLAVAVHGVRISGLRIGQRVLVLGAGTIGLMAVVAARAGGAGEILVTARRPQQKAAACWPIARMLSASMTRAGFLANGMRPASTRPKRPCSPWRSR